MINKTIYKIKRLSDGKYSTGGSRPSFTTNGKAWTNIGHLKNHLNLVIESNYEYHVSGYFVVEYKNRKMAWPLNYALDVYKDCEIEVYEVIIEKVDSLVVKTIFDEALESYKKNNSYLFKE